MVLTPCSGTGKYTADSLTLTAGTSTDTVTDLDTLFDGNVYHINEVAATPGYDMYVEFVNVTDFDYVQVIGHYEGASTHEASIQLYDWAAGLWATWNRMNGIARTTGEYGFYVPCPDNYIGTGANDGKVRVRFNHTMAGNPAHDIYLDVVALYDRMTRVTSLETRVTSLETRVTNLETRVTNLEGATTDVNNIYNESPDTYIEEGRNVFREKQL